MTDSASNHSWQTERVITALGECRLGSPIVFLDEVDTTIDEAWSRCEAGAAEGTTIVAECQTRGRGRSGGEWHSPPYVGMWSSVVLRPQLDANKLPLLTMTAGLAGAFAAEAVGTRVLLKWPNDLVAPDGTGRKIAGVLAESRTESSGQLVAVLSAGVNLNQLADDFPEDLRPKATSLRQVAGDRIEREDFLISYLKNLEKLYGWLENDRASLLVEEWRSRSAILGKSVRVKGGAAEIEGIAHDIADSGALIVRLNSGAQLEVRGGELQVMWDQHSGSRGIDGT